MSAMAVFWCAIIKDLLFALNTRDRKNVTNSQKHRELATSFNQN